MNMLGSTGKICAVLFMGVLLFLLGGSARADDTVISNTINVTSSSGGNTASGGQTVEGTSHSEVHIESNINGETHVVDKESTGTPITVDETITSSNGTTSIIVKTESGSDTPALSQPNILKSETKAVPKPKAVVHEPHEEPFTVSDVEPPLPEVTSTSSAEASTTEEAAATSSSHSEISVIKALSRFIAYVFSFFSF